MQNIYLFYFSLFCLITVFNIKRVNKDKSYSIDTTLSNEIKGLAIFCVLAGHLSRDSGISNAALNFLGAVGVVLFLFMSGYGLTKSYKKKGIEKTYIKKRFMTVLLPYIIVTFIWIMVNTIIFHKNYSIKFIILSIIGFEPNKALDTTMWYIQFAIIWYIAYGLIFKLKIHDIIKLSCLVMVSIVFYLYYNYSSYPLLNTIYQEHVHAFIFPIGVAWGLYDELIMNYLKKKNAIGTLIIMVVFILGVLIIKNYHNIVHNDNAYITYNLLVGMGMIIILNIVNYFGYVSTFLITIGSLSYNIYLFEGVFRESYSVFRYFPGNISLHIYFFVVILLSILLKKVLDFIKSNKKVTYVNEQYRYYN